MDKQQTARWNRQLKLKQVRQDHATVPVPGLVTRAFARHDALLTAADDLMAAPAGRSEGATLKKSTEERNLIAVVVPIANALHLLYLEAQDEEKAYALRRNKSDYQSLPGPLVLAEARNVAAHARANAKALAAEAELDKADLDELDQATAAFSALLTAPKVARETGKASNSALDAALRAADAHVKQTLAPAIETLKRKQPAFYAALREALRIDDAPGARAEAPEPPTPTDPTA
ncbi:hypothetical protein [Hymenobacter sp.]|uniref:hypothetical protein n=1 Tax=Hymenobacter sp. TaxID=1898978 RepID=UPI00286A1E91|nr:hypothetical protein [Hymenobacter sp.]